MSRTRNRTRDVVSTSAVIVAAALLLVTLPLLAFVVVAFRVAVVIAFACALVGGAIAYAVSPGFRSRLGRLMAAETLYKGLRLGSDVALDRGHAWVRFLAGTAIVGSDDLAPHLLGPLDGVELPVAGDRVERGKPVIRLRARSRTIELASPVSGRVELVNDALRTHADLVNRDPYARGWALRLTCDDPREQCCDLLMGRRARDWFRSEVDRLIAVLSGDERASVVADGGALVDGLPQMIEDAEWERVRRSFFGGGHEAA